MTTLESLIETVENYKGIEEETMSENSDKDIYDVLTFGDKESHESIGHELPYSYGHRKYFSFED